MPTLSASNHLRTAHYYDLAGKLGMLPPEGLSALTASGTLRDEGNSRYGRLHARRSS
jgi:hypothetical protein